MPLELTTKNISNVKRDGVNRFTGSLVGKDSIIYPFAAARVLAGWQVELQISVDNRRWHDVSGNSAEAREFWDNLNDLADSSEDAQQARVDASRPAIRAALFIA